MTRIPVSEPNLTDRERRYLIDAFDSTWISSKGKYIDGFEEAFSRYIGVKGAVSVFNGTAAVHLALEAAGIGKGHEVILPTFTYVATANAVRYTGATPVLVDCLEDTWQMDTKAVEKRINSRTRGIIPVHLYGNTVDMAPLKKMVRKKNIRIIEDAAEAIGSTYRKKMTGSIGDVGCFSFFGNKTITTGEGGMITTDDRAIERRARVLRNQGMDPKKRYYHSMIGFNYRMTNLQAAIGLAQLERIDELREMKRTIAMWYSRHLDHPEIRHPVTTEGATNTHWMYSIIIDRPRFKRAAFMEGLDKRYSIETRPFFYPVHTLPMYRTKGRFPVADRISSNGLNLPSGTTLKEDQVRYVCDSIIELLGKK